MNVVVVSPFIFKKAFECEAYIYRVQEGATHSSLVLCDGNETQQLG
jgi:hypothetical protein